jgi:rhamnulokinase
VAAVPAQGSDWAYISSGTWSLMGVETDRPVISDTAYRFNFTNEGGVGKTFRLLKNINGLWLVQRCRRDLARKKAYTWAGLMALAASARPFKCFIDPDDPAFLNPEDMPEAIRRFCGKSGQPRPVSVGGMIRCALESLAMRYRETLAQIRRLVGHPVNRIHVIGGGAKNRLLCQFTADACGIPVLAGPVEATASGNIMVQAMACGLFSSVREIRAVIGKSCEPTLYEPENREAWDAAYEHFKRICP